MIPGVSLEELGGVMTYFMDKLNEISNERNNSKEKSQEIHLDTGIDIESGNTNVKSVTYANEKISINGKEYTTYTTSNLIDEMTVLLNKKIDKNLKQQKKYRWRHSNYKK